MDFHYPLLLGATFLRDRQWLTAATVCFLLSFAYTAGTLGDRRHYSTWWNLGVVVVGFVLQTVFLWQRGAAVGRCPLTNHFEVVAFLSWALVLFYLAVGNTYRLSPLGLFTAPLAFGLQTFALVGLHDWLPGAERAHPHPGVNPSLEFHAAFSVLSFGAFALAALAGGMYLWQERQLKSHRLKVLFFQLPPISDLSQLNARLLALGLALLTLGLAAGINMGTPNTRPHLVWAIVIWVLYAFLVQARWGRWRLAPRRVASLSVAAFTVALLTLGGLSFVRI